MAATRTYARAEELSQLAVDLSYERDRAYGTQDFARLTYEANLAYWLAENAYRRDAAERAG